MTTEDSDRCDEQRRRRHEEREAWREERRQERESRRRQRKGRILHTRISEQLAKDIRAVADDLRVPVSNLVERAQKRMRRRRRHRHAGCRPRWSRTEGEAADLESMEPEEREDVEAEIREAEAEPHRERPEFPDVVGWQPLLLNRDQTCADCGRELRRGTRAFVGLTAAGLSQKTLCRACVNSRE
jgi:hypothetical protein